MLSNRNCFKLLVKMISAFSDCNGVRHSNLTMQMLPFRILGRGIADRSVRDYHVADKPHRLNGRTSAQRFCVLTILPPVTALAVGLPAQRALSRSDFVRWHF